MGQKKRRKKKQKIKNRAKAVVRKKKRQAGKGIRSFLQKVLILLLCLLIGYGCYDYYQNRNLNQTQYLLMDIYEKAIKIPHQIESLIRTGKKYYHQMTGGIQTETQLFSLEEVPPYSGEPYVVLNHNVPDFNDDERSFGAFEYYSDLDYLGRCGRTEAMITREIMPTEKREEIGMIRPTGWHTVKYDCITDRYLYNRCHLIAFELSGENANEKNLITGTRYMNVSGMLPFENMIAQYVRRTGDKVIYRSTPIFVGEELVARGVHMEAESIGSDEIRFNVYVYNVQPGVGIDYFNGDSWRE